MLYHGNTPPLKTNKQTPSVSILAALQTVQLGNICPLFLELPTEVMCLEISSLGKWLQTGILGYVTEQWYTDTL